MGARSSFVAIPTIVNIYDFTVKARNGSEVSLADYKGRVLLIVNTATGCGFTPQYDVLQDIYDAFQDKGFEILDFPCNQFGEQAPGDDEEIHSFCTGRFGITFPQFSKVDVNGENAIPCSNGRPRTASLMASGCLRWGLCFRALSKRWIRTIKTTAR